MTATNDLPSGLQEYAAALGDPEYSGELIARLLDLPENGFRSVIAKHTAALEKVAQEEQALTAARKAAREIAEKAFRDALANWTIQEIQEATGYDDV